MGAGVQRASLHQVTTLQYAGVGNETDAWPSRNSFDADSASLSAAAPFSSVITSAARLSLVRLARPVNSRASIIDSSLDVEHHKEHSRSQLPAEGQPHPVSHHADGHASTAGTQGRTILQDSRTSTTGRVMQPPSRTPFSPTCGFHLPV